MMTCSCHFNILPYLIYKIKISPPINITYNVNFVLIHYLKVITLHLRLHENKKMCKVMHTETILGLVKNDKETFKDTYQKYFIIPAVSL